MFHPDASKLLHQLFHFLLLVVWLVYILVQFLNYRLAATELDEHLDERNLLHRDWKLLSLYREIRKEEKESLISTPFTLDWIEWCVDFLDAFLVLFQDAKYMFVYSISQFGGYLSWHSGAFK